MDPNFGLKLWVMLLSYIVLIPVKVSSYFGNAKQKRKFFIKDFLSEWDHYALKVRLFLKTTRLLLEFLLMIYLQYP